MTTIEPPGPSFPAQPPRRTSRAGLELIKSFEGFRPRAARLPGGRYVVGYGHISSTREGVRISEADAHALLVYDLLQIEQAVNEWALAPLTQNQFDALVSFALSVGLKNFRRSNVLRHVNQGSMIQAAGALEMWRQAELDGEALVIDALVRRRAAEKALFLTPPDGHVPASSAVLRPLIDYSAHASVPRRAPEEVSVPLTGEEATVTRGPMASVTPELEAVSEPDPSLETAVVPDLPVEGQAADAFSAEPAEAMQGPVAEPVEASELVAPEAPASPEPEVGGEPEEEDDEWSAARAAAAAVTARLHELLPKEGFVAEDEEELEMLPLHPSPPDEAADLELAAGGDTLPEIEPFPLSEIEERAGDSNAESLTPFPAVAQAEPSAADDDQGDRRANEPEELPPLDLGAFEPLPTPPEPTPTGPYLLIGLVGLLFIIAALVSLFRTPAPEDAIDGVSTLSWVLGLIGIAGVAAALWMTLGREETGSEEASKD